MVGKLIHDAAHTYGDTETRQALERVERLSRDGETGDINNPEAGYSAEYLRALSLLDASLIPLGFSPTLDGPGLDGPRLDGLSPAQLVGDFAEREREASAPSANEYSEPRSDASPEALGLFYTEEAWPEARALFTSEKLRAEYAPRLEKERARAEDFQARALTLVQACQDAAPADVPLAGGSSASGSSESSSAGGSTDGSSSEKDTAAAVAVGTLAGIGALLGAIAAALPALKPYLPAQLRTLLP
ncbi:hypothetical protein [Corynebacterium sp.]|uniref:hypothetical protein n=1 Tax=Corynebacterium sp. TaxID=1720 RepID=UPI0026DAC23F|nr:hypothetical protein [Corynebacterium sp.]MDO5031287.1 hypothetical protein [Corynebacterium sp.]